MIVAWLALLAPVVALLAWAPTARSIGAAVWPGKTPLNIHDDRARDPHLRHLARILATESAETQSAVADITERLLTSGSITLHEGTAAARQRLGSVPFLTDTPTADRDLFLRRLADALDHIEAL